VLAQEKALRAQFDLLIQAEKQSDQAEKAAEQAKNAIRTADDTMQEEAKKAANSAKSAASTAERSLRVAAESMASELSVVEDTANLLDTGVHPHGAKWWRYRYEHAYIEALLMVFITWLMLFLGEARQFCSREGLRAVTCEEKRHCDSRDDVHSLV